MKKEERESEVMFNRKMLEKMSGNENANFLIFIFVKFFVVKFFVGMFPGNNQLDQKKFFQLF